MLERSDYRISMSDIHVSYPLKAGGRKVVLYEVGLHVRAGEFVTVVGPSGCGKSTLLRIILGSEFPTKGTVLVDGDPVTGVARDRGIVFQKYSLFPNMSVLNNIALGPILEETSLFDRIFHTPNLFRIKKRSQEKAHKLLTRVGLDPRDANKYPHQLSGGMQQRVAIAQTIIMRPKILLMDEPFGALDHNTREEMQLLMLEQWEEHNITILFVTHDLEEACFLGTRVLGLSQYWSHDPGVEVEGAVLVTDKVVPGGHPKPSEFKYSPEFNDLLKTVRRDVLDPDHRQHLSEFDHDHKDAWRPTLEWSHHG